MEHFHPAVRQWFSHRFAAPSPPQSRAWAALARGSHVLVSAPTGSGKTLAAFLTAIDALVREALAGTLEHRVRVVYVSPLKALSNDIHHNLDTPLGGIQEILDADPALRAPGAPEIPRIESAVRTGDTSAWERTRMTRSPPHILVTTPESLYLLLTSESGRNMLSTADTLIVDEIHALLGSKRGAHLALSIARLEKLCGRELTRIGLSATQEPIDVVRGFLVGNTSRRHCEVVNTGHERERDLGICLPGSPLGAVMAGEAWTEIHGLLEGLVLEHRTTLIFVNTRRLAERLAKALDERLGERVGEGAVTSHHGSLAKEHRLDAEQRLKSGRLRALVATASLELGIDIGDIDLVCQIGSPRAVSAFLQRVGRSGHALEKTPRGRLFPLSRDDLVECVALLGAVSRGHLDQLAIYPAPLDVLAQQITAEVSAGEVGIDALYEMVVSAAPYTGLERARFDAVLKMVAEGFNGRRGRHSAYIHLDEINRLARPRKSARLTALTNGGAIPDQFDYEVILQPEGLRIGTLNEDFAFESMAGDVFQLGNASYQIMKVETGRVFVRDARGQPPRIPFWFGEAPGRTDAVSQAVSRLRGEVAAALEGGVAAAERYVLEHYPVNEAAAGQLVDYLGAAHAALGALPTADTVIFERFFDEAGDQHFVVHSAFGSRVNRAWGLALRKRFCRKFNFELQAAALEDTIVLSLGATHSFALEEPAGYLKSVSFREVLTQAVLDAPMFATHWRWNATIALAVKRFSGGRKTPPQFQRSNAEDLVALVFPDQIACAENLAGYREIPDHPLVSQTLHDCLNNLMDADGLEAVLGKLERGEIRLVCRDLVGPSLLSEEVLNARPYAFLDDAPAEERRTSLVRARRFLHPQDAEALGELDQRVIDEIRGEAWPGAGNRDECHDALMILGGVLDEEAVRHGWTDFLGVLEGEGRACALAVGGRRYWCATERLHLWRALHPGSGRPGPAPVRDIPPAEHALADLLRMRLQGIGPVTEQALAAFFQVSPEAVAAALAILEQEGFAMRGEFEAGASGAEQWCERGLLARIHRRSLGNLRKQVRAVPVTAFMRFLFAWQGLDGEADGEGNPEQLAAVLEQLEGVSVAAAAWEESVLPARLAGFKTYWLDILCSSGRLTWRRSRRSAGRGAGAPTMNGQSPVSLYSRLHAGYWSAFKADEEQHEALTHRGRKIRGLLRDEGPRFFDDLAHSVGMPTEVESGLSELAGAGLVTSDNFAGLRALIHTHAAKGRRRGRGRGQGQGQGMGMSGGMMNAGRWSLVEARSPDETDDAGDDRRDWNAVEHIADVLLKRYGVVFRKLLEAEPGLPAWRDLHYVYRRMEARGEVRGGRFVDGFSGEQFALPAAAGLLRKINNDPEQRLVSISAADPLNLTGIILPQERVPGVRKNRLIFRNGGLIAIRVAGEIHWLTEVDDSERWSITRQLERVRSRPDRRPRFSPQGSVH